jgi:hypothetical protein
MGRKALNLALAALASASIVAACSGSELKDVGDINGAGDAGESGDLAPEGGAHGMPTGGSGSGSGGARPPEVGGMGGEDTVLHEGGTASFRLDELECELCELLAEGSRIRDVTVTQDRVFWLEYGTIDALDNHQGDGRLLSLPLSGGEPTLIASNLPGPFVVHVGQDFAYVGVDQSSEPSGKIQTLRLALDDGAVELLDPVPVSVWTGFTVHAGVAYWVATDAVYQLAEQQPGPATLFFESPNITTLLADDPLIFVDSDGIKSLPYTGGDPTLLLQDLSAAGPHGPIAFTVNGGFIYALNDDQTRVIGVPKTGGAWKNVAETSGEPWHLKVDADQYFVDPFAMRGTHRIATTIVQGTLGDAASGTTLLRAPLVSDVYLPWDIAPGWVYFGVEHKLYRVPRID